MPTLCMDMANRLRLVSALSMTVTIVTDDTPDDVAKPQHYNASEAGRRRQIRKEVGHPATLRWPNLTRE